jgi:hypothetical protein
MQVRGDPQRARGQHTERNEDRQASTLFPELNKAWFGESLVFSYAAREKSVHLPRHDYRFCWRAVLRTLEECCRAGWAATRPIRTEQDHTRPAL